MARASTKPAADKPQATDAGKDAVKPATTATAEQLGNQPAGSTTTDAAALAAASTEITTSEPPPGGPDQDAGNQGQEAHLSPANEPPKTIRVVVYGTGSPSALALIGMLNAEGEYAVTLPRPLQLDELEERDSYQGLFASEREIEGVFVRAVPEAGFRRCGMSFTREGHGIALGALNKELLQALMDEPNLIVEPSYFSDEA